MRTFAENGQSPSAASREIRRNPAARNGKIDHRPSALTWIEKTYPASSLAVRSVPSTCIRTNAQRSLVTVRDTERHILLNGWQISSRKQRRRTGLTRETSGRNTPKRKGSNHFTWMEPSRWSLLTGLNR